MQAAPYAARITGTFGRQQRATWTDLTATTRLARIAITLGIDPLYSRAAIYNRRLH